MTKMLEQIMDLLKLAVRQKNSVYFAIEALKNCFDGFSIKKIFSVFIAIIEMFGSVLFDTPFTHFGPELDLTGYELVFEDNFDGDELDLDVWRHRAEGERRCGYNSDSQVKLENGNCVFTGEYLKDGKYGEGWYAGMIALRNPVCRGYFEIRCKCNRDKGFWSAFWIQSITDPYDHYLSNGGINGAELDIFEAMNADAKTKGARNSVSQTIHCNGSDDDVENIDSCCVGKFKVGNDIFDEYNTYGLKWTEDEYIFYINGRETARSTFGKGVSTVPEELIVSLEIPFTDAELSQYGTDYKTQMIVDYVKIWQQ